MVLLSQNCCLRNVSRKNEKFACRADSTVYSALHHAFPLLAKVNFTRLEYWPLVFHFEVLCSLNSYLISVFSCKDLWDYVYTRECFGWKSQAQSTGSELYLSSNMQICRSVTNLRYVPTTLLDEDQCSSESFPLGVDWFLVALCFHHTLKRKRQWIENESHLWDYAIWHKNYQEYIGFQNKYILHKIIALNLWTNQSFS